MGKVNILNNKYYNNNMQWYLTLNLLEIAEIVYSAYKIVSYDCFLFTVSEVLWEQELLVDFGHVWE